MLPTSLYATAFTSVTTGNWNDGATWGLNSPGVKGTDWPGTAGDTFLVSAGDTVTYNVSETNELGTSSLDGKLVFDPGGNRKLTFASVIFTIAATGELEIGTSGTPFNENYTADILWNTTADNSKGLTVTSGGKLTIYGSPTFRSDYTDSLADSSENTDNDTVIKTNSDMSAIWAVGDELIFRSQYKGDTASETGDSKIVVIQSFSGVDITVDIAVACAAGVGDTYVSTVYNLERNVRFSKLGALTSINGQNTNRPRLVDNSPNLSTNAHMSYCDILGFYSIDAVYSFTFANSIVRNGRYGFLTAQKLTFTDSLIISMYFGFSSQSNGIGTFTGSVIASKTAISATTGTDYGIDVHSCETAIAGGSATNRNTFSGNIFNCGTGLNSASGWTVTGDIYDCTYGTNSSGGKNIFTGDFYNCTTAIDDQQNAIITGSEIYGCTTGIYNNASSVITGANIHNNSYGIRNSKNPVVVDSFIHTNSLGFYGCDNIMMTGGAFGYDPLDASHPNTVDDIGQTATLPEWAHLTNVKLPATGLNLPAYAAYFRYIIFSENNDETYDDNVLYQAYGRSTKLAFDGTGDAPSVDPDGGTGYGLELKYLSSYGDSNSPLTAWGKHNFRIWTAAAETTYTFPIQTTYNSTAVGGLTLTALYLDEAATSSHMAEATDDSAITIRTNDADWTNSLSVTFTPTQEGWVYITIDLSEYQSSDEIYIWPIPTELSASHETTWLSEGAGIVATSGGAAAATTAYGHF